MKRLKNTSDTFIASSQKAAVNTTLCPVNVRPIKKKTGNSDPSSDQFFSLLLTKSRETEGRDSKNCLVKAILSRMCNEP
jgi:hypothetical protein